MEDLKIGKMINNPENLGKKEEKKEHVKIKELAGFDIEYFHEIQGPESWIAIGQENCSNQRYFTVLGKNGEKLGIVGVYDFKDDKNIVHVVVDPKHRGEGLAAEFKKKIMEQLGLSSIVLTIDLDNESSLKSAQKLPGIKKISDDIYEKRYNKAKFFYELPEEGEAE